MAGEHVDVLIVGAGVSGIGAACHLRRECPGKSYAILERRTAIGGTWDLFRYPGIRSDSDMFTFGYRFRPWLDMKVLADGTSIRHYVEETAAEYGVTEHIRFGLKVLRANWSSTEKRWSVEALREETGEVERYTCDFLLGCTGYYNYDTGYRPDFPGEDRFRGDVVHPQHWPEDLDYQGKRVVVIGSGATAVTLIPAMVDEAAHVTMLQRSPTYIVTVPATDALSAALQKVLPTKAVYQLARGRNVALQRLLYSAARRFPNAVRKIILAGVRHQVGPDVDMRHFTPHYDPWDQRLCIVPNGDLFRVVRSGTASVVTDHIETFTEDGIRLESGEHLDADVIITATGLDVQMMGGAEVSVDEDPVVLRDRLAYKSVMVGDVPNAALVFGYVNASWTLKADIACDYVCRLLNYMDEHGHRVAVARQNGAEYAEESVLSALNAGYVRRGQTELPRQGVKAPWRVSNNYFSDIPLLRLAPIDDGVLTFDPVAPDAAVADEETAAAS
ncbi:MAG: NAD(P)-binding protein [Actinophytocola sp.]|nr:NAD(P)-binding protein [Actinophytocola sp.]